MVRVQIYWYQLQDKSVVGLRKEGSEKAFCSKEDRTLVSLSDPSKAKKRILGTFVIGDGSSTLLTLAEMWLRDQAIGEWGKEHFEWDESSLDILKAYVKRLPLDKKRAQRKKDCQKLENALDIAKDAGEDIKVRSEEVKQMKNSIARLVLVIEKETRKISQYEAKCDEVHNGERGTKKTKAKRIVARSKDRFTN
ncbi:uncharacterized protein EAF02_004286 [Botrytis sinoallii]|uniref:uncharacterized protein n=1 Tax=Botrytis sinoallii TaxID=1463999 RepID=UPI0018FF6ACC|nr:uncharacterized protein EAF02_004286 [Botrytis sinoallii]KAF7885777.1 hypothetical protein EAF02_004286 [Botrytis sinoallii]